MIDQPNLLSIDGPYAAAYSFTDLPFADRRPDPTASMFEADEILEPRIGQFVVKDGVAIVDVCGLLSKQPTRYGSSYVELRSMFRLLKHAELIDRVLIRFDSPGGAVHGVADAASDLAALAKVKTVVGHIDDVCCGSAYWLAAQCPRLTAGPTALIGSIGIAAGYVDSSQHAKRNGVKVHRIATGPLKGAGIPWTAISDEQLQAWRDRVNDYYGHFIEAIETGRGMDRSQVQTLATGGCWIGNNAKSVGLIDGVESFDDAFAQLKN